MAAICRNCIEDPYIRQHIEESGQQLDCSECGESELALALDDLGKYLEPVLRENFDRGEEYKTWRNADDDRGYWIQQGDSLPDILQEALGQYLECNDALADAVAAAEDVWPQRGEEPFWDSTCNYVRRPASAQHFHSLWLHTLNELKHNRRFFSAAAKELFVRLFDDIDDLRASVGKRKLPVVRTLATGTQIYRARICSSKDQLHAAFKEPFAHVGPPPPQAARAGRMNAEGVVVFYGAKEPDTCRAELRPALSSEIVQIAVRTTRPLRVLDFSRLEAARSGKALSIFQPDYQEQRAKRVFLKHLHELISQPIVPGHEADYLITQTMAEYLAHVHSSPFDGILFSSAQRTRGTNFVLFADPTLLTNSMAEAFRLEYVADSIGLFSTVSIQYKHEPMPVFLEKERGTPLWRATDDLDLDAPF